MSRYELAYAAAVQTRKDWLELVKSLPPSDPKRRLAFHRYEQALEKALKALEG